MNRDYVTITQAAKLIGVSRMTIYRYLAEGRLKAIDTSHLYPGHGPRRIPRDQVEALIPRLSEVEADLNALPKPKP